MGEQRDSEKGGKMEEHGRGIHERHERCLCTVVNPLQGLVSCQEG